MKEFNLMIDYTDVNARTIDKWVEAGWEWSVPVTREAYAAAKVGDWDVGLTPIKRVPKAWFNPFINDNRLRGARLLGLASGGGQQMPIFAAAGADCTVLDNSLKQLENERIVSEREGYEIKIIRADMTKRLPFEDGSFDIIFHPVSNVYIEDVHHVWNECFRLLAAGGVLLSGLDNGINFVIEDPTATPMVITGRLPHNPLKLPEAELKKIAEGPDGIQFSHTLEDQIGGQLRAGFVITDVYEDLDNFPESIASGIPLYWASRAVKPLSAEDGKIIFMRG